MTSKGARSRVFARLSLLLIVTGIALMAMMIVVEDELGAIPLLLIALGVAGYWASGRRALSRRQ